jgi:hypothetical protein
VVATLPTIVLLSQPTSSSVKKRNWLDGFVGVGCCCWVVKMAGELGFGKWVISRRNKEWSKGKLLLEFYFPEIQNNTPEYG